MEGGLDWDVVGVNAWSQGATMDAGSDPTRNSKMSVRLAGNTFDPTVPDNCDNNVAFWYLGRMDGDITFDLSGSSLNDWVSANLWFNQGSHGRVGNGQQDGARVRGGAGNDDMQYIVRGDQTARLLEFNTLVAEPGEGDRDHLTRAATPPLDVLGELTRSGFDSNSTVSG